MLLAVAAGVAYSNSFAGAFVLDDEPAIVENPHLRPTVASHVGDLSIAVALVETVITESSMLECIKCSSFPPPSPWAFSMDLARII